MKRILSALLMLIPLLAFTQLQSTFVKYNDFATFPLVGNTKVIYLDNSSNKIYQWNGTTYIQMSVSATFTDNVDGTVTMDGENTNHAIRPINELSVKNSIDDNNDYVPIFDATTGAIKKINKVTFANNEILYTNSALIGTVPAGKQLGINTATGEFYYRNSADEWALQPLGVQVNLIVNSDGTKTVNAGLGGIEKISTPTNELPITQNIKSTDRFTMWNDTNHVAISKSDLSNSIISATPVEYDNHYFIGKKSNSYLGYSYPISFPNSYIIVGNDLSNGNSVSGTYSDMSTFIIDLNNMVNGLGNSTIFTYHVNGSDYIVYTVSGFQDGLQIAIRDDNTGNWINSANTSNPDGDAIEGEIPYMIQVSDGISEPIIVNNDSVRVGDEVLFIRGGGTTIISGDYIGWSQPEAVQWSNIPNFYNTTTWNLYLSVGTDGLGSSIFTTTGQSYNTFEDLISWYNIQLSNYGSSFRLLSAGDNRVFLCDVNLVPLLESAPYIINNQYAELVLEIMEVSSTDYLIKGTNPKLLSVSNVSLNSGTKLYKGYLPQQNSVSTNYWGLDGNASTSGKYLGTTDLQPLSIRTNGTERMVVTSNGEVGIGSATPSAWVDIRSTYNQNANKPLINAVSNTTIQNNSISSVGISNSYTAVNSTGFTAIANTGISNISTITNNASTSRVNGFENNTTLTNLGTQTNYFAGFDNIITKNGIGLTPIMYGIRNISTLSTSATSIFGIENSISLSSGSTATTTIGSRNTLTCSGAGGTISAGFNNLNVTATGTGSNANVLNNAGILSNTGFTGFFGINNSLNMNTTGGATSTYGIYNKTVGSLGFTSLSNYGIYNEQVVNNTVGTIYGLNILQSGAGSVTNSYGIRIDGIIGSNKWALYQSDANARNFFAGNTGMGAGVTSPNATLQINGSISTNATVIALTYTVIATDNTIICNNTTTNITVTLPNPSTCIGREVRIGRYAGSTGSITITNTGIGSIQALNGTIGATTSLASAGAFGQRTIFKAVTVGATTSWLRIQ